MWLAMREGGALIASGCPAAAHAPPDVMACVGAKVLAIPMGVSGPVAVTAAFVSVAVGEPEAAARAAEPIVGVAVMPVAAVAPAPALSRSFLPACRVV